MVEHVANDFENEYMQPDDPSRHGRVFTVTEADAYLVLRAGRSAEPTLSAGSSGDNL